jgi:hypothetical protein
MKRMKDKKEQHYIKKHFDKYVDDCMQEEEYIGNQSVDDHSEDEVTMCDDIACDESGLHYKCHIGGIWHDDELDAALCCLGD